MKRTRNLTPAFVAALRDELQQFGGALALLDGARPVSPEAREDFPGVFRAQTEELNFARGLRLQAQQALSLQLGLSALTPFHHLIGKIEANRRPQIVALVEENFHLLLRLRRRAQAEHVRFQRSLAGLERVIEIISSQDAPVQSAGESHHTRTDPPGTGINAAAV